jgi:rod shape-determining protein MreC
VVAIPSFWDERKLLVFLALIIVASATMLFEIDAARRGGQSLADEIVGTVVTPIARAINGIGQAIGSEAYVVTHAGVITAENARLAQKSRDLAAANERLKARGDENIELRRMLGVRLASPSRTIEADVVGYTPEAARKEIAIDRGTRDGVQRNDVVVNGEGLVGHVIDAGAHFSHVLLVMDPTSAVPAFLLRTHTWGIVFGSGPHARMKYIGQDVKVLEGDKVVTGLGEIYPAGIPIGAVLEVDRKDNALYQVAVLQPAIDIASLAHVLVLTSK